MADWPYNTAAWKRLRLAHLKRNPLCVFCQRRGEVVAATTVDHRVPVREDKARAFDPTNLQSLCTPCHSSEKQRIERGGGPVGCDENGIPLRGWE
jgi:5-methylcytosine-specific restriction protein A